MTTRQCALNADERQRLMDEALVDERTLARILAGLPVRPATVARIERALERTGLKRKLARAA